MPLLSTFVLGINCASNTYNFAAIVAVDAIDTEIDQCGSSSSPQNRHHGAGRGISTPAADREQHDLRIGRAAGGGAVHDPHQRLLYAQ